MLTLRCPAKSLLKRMVLVKPGLGERLIAELEEEPHIDRITARHDEVELGAPMAVNAVLCDGWTKANYSLGPVMVAHLPKPGN